MGLYQHLYNFGHAHKDDLRLGFNHNRYQIEVCNKHHPEEKPVPTLSPQRLHRVGNPWLCHHAINILYPT